ncbi:MAG: lysophospholipid acyltransferase family protein [Gammaproteobacteria bacterium]
MKKIRVAYRLVLLGVHIVVGLAIIATLLRRGESRPPGEREREVIRWWQRRSSHILGLNIKVVGSLPQRPVLVVSNHISWLDIPVLGSVLPVSFVSKSEIRSWPLLGIISGRGGTLYIRRGGKNAANQAAEQIAFRLRRGDNIVLFPEGTTTDGHSVRRFHPRLFGAAVHAEADVQPVAIRYPHPLGVHPAAPFVNNEPLFSHGLRALGEKRIDVEVTLCPPLTCQPVDRRTLAKLAHEAILEVVEQRSPDQQRHLRG